VPDTSTLYSDVQQEWKDVFGSDLITTPNTPQGVIIVTDTLARAATVGNNSQLANQLNPNEAGGVHLDAIGALTNAKRIFAKYTTVSANLTGVPGTVIPQGSLAEDSVTGYQFALNANVTLNGSGQGSGIFKCTTAGAITVAAGDLTSIVVGGVLGWETVDNPAAQIQVGAATESDDQFRNRRRAMLAMQATSISEAITSGLYAIGVKSLKFRQNYTSAPLVIDDITLVANSIYVCVNAGGISDNDIATVLDNKKSGGCNYNGGTTVNITDPFSGQVIPVKFDHATPVPITARFTVTQGEATQDPTTAIKTAVLAYANGELPQEPGLIVGQDVSPWEFAGAVNRLYPGIFIKKVEISKVTPLDFSTDEIPIPINEIATIIEANIAVVIE
jgi:hypothetical protein